MCLAQRLRQLIACYGATIAINLELVMGIPSATPRQPDPLVRIDSRLIDPNDWHPNELVELGSDRRFVIVWDLDESLPAPHPVWMTHIN
jgi:hypothetical protein